MNSVTCAKPSGPGGFGQYLILSYSTSSSGTFVNFISPENYLFPVYFQIIEMNLDIILKFKNLYLLKKHCSIFSTKQSHVLLSHSITFAFSYTCILLKYCPASNGTTLYVEIPITGLSVGFLAL